MSIFANGRMAGLIKKVWDGGATFAAYTLVSNLLTGISGMVVIRFLDPLSLGWWNSSQLLRVPFDFLRAGILSGMNREYPYLVGANRPEESRRVLETGFAYTLITIGVSQAALAGVLFAVRDREPMLLLGLAASGMAWSVGSYSQYVRSMLRTSHQFLLTGKVGLVVACIDTTAVLLVWRFGYVGLVGRALISVGATALLYYQFQPVRVRPRLQWAVLQQLFRFGRHTFVTSFVLLLGTQAERILLLTVPDGVRLLGLYTPALVAASLLQIVPGNLQSYHYPKIIEEFGRTDDRRALSAATLALIKQTFLMMSAMAVGAAIGIVVLVQAFLPLYRAGLPAALIVCLSGPFLACRMGSTYFAALQRWPEYYIYTVLQSLLPYAAIYFALQFLPPLVAVAAGSVVALAVASITLVVLLLAHSRRAQGQSMITAKIISKFGTIIDGLRARIHADWLRLQGVQIAKGARVFSGAMVECQGGRISIGAGTTVHPGARIYAAGGSIVIGQRCSINPGCLIYGHGGLVIGDDVRIAGNTVIIPANHKIDAPGMEVRLQGETREGIAIGNDVWIGAGSIILDGVHLADGTVIGAGAVATKSTQSNGIYVGNPARLLRFRGTPAPVKV